MVLECSVFLSTFPTTKLAVRNWRMSSLDAFIDSLTKEKDKLVQMGALKTSNYHALKNCWSKNSKSKGKQKLNQKKWMSDDEDSSNLVGDYLKKKKKKKKGRSKCSYYRKGSHSRKYYFKKKSGMMTQFLERHNNNVL